MSHKNYPSFLLEVMLFYLAICKIFAETIYVRYKKRIFTNESDCRNINCPVPFKGNSAILFPGMQLGIYVNREIYIILINMGVGSQIYVGDRF